MQGLEREEQRAEGPWAGGNLSLLVCPQSGRASACSPSVGSCGLPASMAASGQPDRLRGGRTPAGVF